MSKKKKSEAWAQNGFEDWGGYMAAKKAKLEEQFHQEANKEFKNCTNLFQGIAIFVNGYTNPTADDLRRLMMEHGGTYHHYMRPRITTHIIASNLPYTKIVQYRKSQNPIPICKPEWITDSINAGKILNFQNYLLYSNCTDTQPQISFKAKSNIHDTHIQSPSTSNNKNNSKSIEKTDFNNISCTTSKSTMSDNTVEALNATNANNKSSRCTRDAEFLSEFYNNSRLHHISTMGAMFKDYVNELRDKNDGKCAGLERLMKLKRSRQVYSSSRYDTDSDDDALPVEEKNTKGMNGSVIMHIDMDCFFVSVGLRNKPELKGFPVAVTHAKNNKLPNSSIVIANNKVDDVEHGSLSEVASCSYEARKAGVKNGMFLGEALKMCPNLKTMPYDFEGYKEVSYALYNTVASYTLDIEAVSCDELYADCTKILEKSGHTPMEFATIIRNEIKEKTGCPVSTGFGNNKLQARLATRKAKPNGQFYLKSDHVESYIGTFNVRDLPGVGGATASKLNKLNVNTCSQLQSVSLATLQTEFGKKIGESLYNMCRGIDQSKLNLEHVRKSVSAEVNYGIRFENNGEAVDFLKKLSDEVCNRLKKANAKGRCVTLKLMVRAKEAPKEPAKFMGHGLCDYLTKSKNLLTPVDDLHIITREVISIWNQLQQAPQDMRGIGIQISRLEILKHKSNSATIMNFVNKSKLSELGSKAAETDTQNNRKQNHSVRNSQWPEKSTKPKSLTDYYCNTATEHLTKNVTPSKTSSLHDAVNNCEKEKSDIQNYSSAAAVTDLSKGHVGGGKSESNLDTLVLSQDISDSVLNELPEDIRKQIVNAKLVKQVSFRNTEYKKLRSNTNRETNNETKLDSVKGVTSDLPADLGLVQINETPIIASQERVDWANCLVDDKTTSAVKRKKSLDEKRFGNLLFQEPNTLKNDMTTPPFENIDESVWNALPEEIKVEIINAKYQKQNQHRYGQTTEATAASSTSCSGNTNLHEKILRKEKDVTIDPLKNVRNEYETENVINAREKSVQTRSALSKCNTPTIVPSTGIDESILNELPNDIRTEIISTMSKVQSPSKPKKEQQIKPVKQQTQEYFFKHIKPNVPRTEKAKMPPIQDIDMHVLIQLPEDIRNEILNEYKASEQEVEKNQCLVTAPVAQKQDYDAITSKQSTNEKDSNAGNISFSQIDPEFLNALSEDIQNDVQMYCMIKKKEKDLGTATGDTGKRRNQPKNYKHIEKNSKTKTILKTSKVTKSKNNKKGSKLPPRTVENGSKNEKKGEEIDACQKAESPVACFGSVEINSCRVPPDEAEIIISHNRNISNNYEKTDKYQDMLVTLVNHLFSLPLEQVKMQIRSWISKSNTVNEVDFLSLATFLSMLPGKKRIEDLHILLKTMHRCMIKTGSCIWHRTYRKTVKHVQQYMQIEYNSNLMVSPIRCSLLTCNSDDVV